MNFKEIQKACSNFTEKLITESNSIRVEKFSDKYGTVGKKVFEYSKRVLRTVGIEPPEVAPTESDLVLARAMSKDVQGGGWEGAGQAISKMFSALLGIDFQSKAVGIDQPVQLPKYAVVKSESNGMCMISDRGNVFSIQGNDFSKVRYFTPQTQDISLPTEDETVLFLGELFDSHSRQLSSTMEISSPEDLGTAIDISSNGLDVQMKDQIEYRSFVDKINPMFTGHKDVA